MSTIVRALILGDTVGQPGCRALFFGLQALVRKTRADLVIANGENAEAGYGLLPEGMNNLFKYGVDVITSGNHIWQRREIYPFLDSESRLLRPENYPDGVPGKGTCLIEKRGVKIGVMNLEGRMYLAHLRDPFQTGRETAHRLARETKVILVDFHAESVEEKEALGLYLDGQVSAVVGTHTHVQTADERILPGGTAYITDIGMTGPSDTVIGMNRDIALRRSLTQMPLKMEVEDRPGVIMGALLEVDADTGRAAAITRIQQPLAV